MLTVSGAEAQDEFNQMTEDGTITKSTEFNKDSTKSDEEIPVGLYVWTIDKRFGDITPAVPDTVPHLFMNDGFTSGRHGEYNTTGNLGSPRLSRIFIDQPEADQFIFTQPYDFFLTPVDKLHFTNTLSPFTNITYSSCGNKTNGEDRLRAIFAVNAGKKIGLGMKFDYMYGRGYYSNQSTSRFNWTLFSSYLGEKYNMHFVFSTNHEKVSENGGITDDNYILHPESFTTFAADEIPTVLEQNWNRNDNMHLFLSHRYSLGFHRKVKMTDAEIKAKKFAMESMKENEQLAKQKEADNKDTKDKEKDSKGKKPVYAGRPYNAVIVGHELPDTVAHKNERINITSTQKSDSTVAAIKKAQEDSMTMKDEYVPVTSFIHTLEWNNYSRIYEAYQTPSNFYANKYYNRNVFGGDSIYDKTNHYSIKNTFAIALLEGFNKYAKAGLKAFVAHEFRHFTLPDSAGSNTIYNEHNISVGGQLSKTQGSLLHYNITAETFLAGEDIGKLMIDGQADLNFKLFNDTIQLAVKAFIHHFNPSFYFRHYHSKNFWWDNGSMDKEIRTRIEGEFSLKRTRTRLRVAIEELRNYTYFSMAYNIDSLYNRTGNSVKVNQCGSNINVISATLNQDFTLGPLNWENEITYQSSSNKSVLPLPTLSIYSNLYLNFRIAKVLLVNLGADVRYFTKYYAPDFRPALNQFCVQNSNAPIEIGNYPIVNVYANMHLKHTRFFIMMSHVNCGGGNKNYFLTPHYPINPSILRMGVSWNFFN